MRAQDFVKKRPVKTLTIFDIDDTLFHTTAKIKVVKDGKVLRTLTNQEFNTYELGPGEEFDFGEFRNAEKFAKESEPIEHMMDELKTILDHTQGTVIMLTARADFDDKQTFLKKFTDHGIDMTRVHVHRAGNLPGDDIPAEKKAVWVRRYLDTGKYNQVSLYDDSMSNLRVFKSLKKKYPKVDFDAYYIAANDVTAVEGRGKRRRKTRYAYGAPWGWYGMDAGYSGDGGDGGGMEEELKRRRWSWSKPGWFSRLENVAAGQSDVKANTAAPRKLRSLKDISDEEIRQWLEPSTPSKPDQGKQTQPGQDSKVRESSYPGNIGVMELAKFFRTATPEQEQMFKKLLANGEKKLVWFLIQKVTGVKLQGDEFDENFADGKNPGRKGLSKRMGVPTKASVGSLRKIAKNSSGEKQRMAHWLANMKSGKSK